MSFNTYPQNPFPSNSELLEKLDVVAKAIDNMPTFTSNDKAFLEELPAFPNVDGKKVLTANTTSGDTSLAYEALENELPDNPSSDGMRVLTATTESGETVKSWETPQTGENQIFSTTPVIVGKWIDNRDLKRVVLPFDATSGSASIDVTSLNIDYAFCVGCFCQEEIYQTYNLAITPLYNSNDDKFSFQLNGARTAINVSVGNEKKGHGAIIICYVEKESEV